MWDLDEHSSSLSVKVCRMFFSLGKPNYRRLTSNSIIFLKVKGICANDTSVFKPDSKNISINET